MDLKQECEQSFYKELYQFDGRPQSLLMDETTGTLYLRKEREVYDESVYAWLQSHHHPNIANVHSFWKEDDRLIILEEYIDGETLEDRLGVKAQDGSSLLTQEERLRILNAVCDGLEFLHSAQPPVIHRDLKASNIMLGKDGVVKIIDYDAARTHKEGLRKDTHLIGTSGVAAPEQYGFAQTDARTDIYALGVLIERLFPEDPAYLSVITKAKQMDPAGRYQTVAELKAALNRQGAFRKRFMPWIVVAAVAVVTAIAALGFREFKKTVVVSEDDETVFDLQDDADEASFHAPSGAFIIQETGETMITTGSFRMRMPRYWERDGAYFYAETGTGVAVFYADLIDDLEISSYEDLYRMREELSRDLIESMLGYIDEDARELTVEKTDFNGIPAIKSVAAFTYLGLETDYEAVFLYDDVMEGVVVLTFLQTQGCQLNHLQDFHAVLESLERIAVPVSEE